LAQQGDLDPGRYPGVSHVLGLLDKGVPAAFGIPGEPACQIRIWPSERHFEILVEGDQSQPSLASLRNLDSSRLEIAGRNWNEVSVSWTNVSVEAYLFVCAVADRVQLLGETLATAVDTVLLGMREVLRREGILTRDQEVGLVGELVILAHLLKARDVDVAADAWLGADSEEHDFCLPELDLEVKTTTSDERSHWITSARQLMPVADRPLQIVSIQITPKDGPEALSLPALANAVMHSSEHRAGSIQRKLESVGYVAEDAGLYPTRWALRTSVAAFEVTADFPKLTPVELAHLGLNSMEITEVKYRINLEGRKWTEDTPVVGVHMPRNQHD